MDAVNKSKCPSCAANTIPIIVGIALAGKILILAAEIHALKGAMKSLKLYYEIHFVYLHRLQVYLSILRHHPFVLRLKQLYYLALFED